MITGIDPWDWPKLTRGIKPTKGTLPDADGTFTRWYENTVLAPARNRMSRPSTSTRR